MKRPMKSSASCLLLLMCALSSTSLGGEECTTAVIADAATTDGRPILWKNRDTDNLSNKVVFVKETPYSYLALVNAEDSSGRFAYGGLNAAGFAIINSVAYNLPKKSGEYQDLEGIVMGDALRTCTTVGDFEEYVKKNLGPSLGCWTNFCVIDAHGGASIFEVHNHGYKRLDAAADSQRCLLNTNFSRSGTPDKGMGYLRFDRETELFGTVPPGKMNIGFILQTATRDVGHALLGHPPQSEWGKLRAGVPYWIHTNYAINRQSTASAIVIQGTAKGGDPRKATLWVILGEPLCSIAVPLWVDAGVPPRELWTGPEAPLSKEAKRLKDMLRPLKGDDRKQYIDLTKLDNDKGTGWLPVLLREEREILAATERFLRGDPSSAELSAFEQRTAAKVVSTLQGIK